MHARETTPRIRLIRLFALLILGTYFIGTKIRNAEISISQEIIYHPGPLVYGSRYDLYEASIADLQAGLEQGLFTSVRLVKVPSTTHLNEVK